MNELLNRITQIPGQCGGRPQNHPISDRTS
jgi:hypothetical protein